MDDFQDGEEKAEKGHNIHHQKEDCLLRGTGNKAVHRVRARRTSADVGGNHLEAVKNILPKKEGHLKGRAPQQLAHIDFHQAVTQDPPATIMFFL